MKKHFLLLMACTLSLMVSARVAYLVPGNTNDKSVIPAQWDNHTFEHTAYDWFNETYVNAGVGDFINFTNIPTNTNEYAAIWIYIDREWKQSGEPWDEGRMDALFTNDVVNALKTYVQNGGNLFLGKQAARLAYRMGRIEYAPNYQCGGYSQDDRFWGIKAKLGSALAAENQRDRSSHPIYAGLATATMDGVEGCFPLLNAVGDAHSTDNNIHWVEYWTPNGEGGWRKNPDNNGDPALIEGWESYWNARALGTWTSIGDYCIIQAVEFMPKDAFTGTILTINIGAYQWNSESTGDAANNMRKLTKNALRYLNRPSRADLKIDNAFHTCGRVDCDNALGHYNDFMILHPVVEGLNAQPYTTSFEGIEEANRAVVEEWQDGETKRLAFTKAGQVKLQINLRESRTDHFWPAGDYAYEQLIDFAFSGDPQAVATEDLSSNGLDGETGKFMILHKNMRGMDATYTTNFEGIAEADRAEVAVVEDGEYNRLTFTKAGTVNLAITLNCAKHNTIYGKGEHNATKTVTFAQPAFNFTHTPDVAAIGEDKPEVAATCTNVPGITAVQYETDNSAIATIDAETGKITYIAEGTCNVYAYILINGVKFRSEAQIVTVNGLNIIWTIEPEETAMLGSVMTIAAAPEYGVATVLFATTNCTYADGALHLDQLGTATVQPYAIVGDKTYYGETKSITVTPSQEVYTRSGLTPGNYGTICLNRTSTALEGAKFYWPAYKNNPEGEVDFIVLEEVNTLTAGQGYFFYATASEIRVTMDLNETPAASPIDNGVATHGMHGNFGPDNMPVPNYDGELPNEYILYENKLCYGKNNYIGANRAYLKMSEVPKESEYQKVPGRRYVQMVVNQENSATGLEHMNLQNSNAAKFIQNGKMYILRSGMLYSTDGRLVK